MKKTFVLWILAIALLPVLSFADETPYIQVSGSAEMEITPDEIILAVGFSEYYEEEYIAGKKYEDYKTKVSLEKIEPLVIKQLEELGIKKEQMTLIDGGNNWRQRGKDFLKRKELHINIKDFKVVDKLMTYLNVRGIDYINIAELKNKDMTEFRKQVKINALKAAKEKAGYLVESVGQKIGKVLYIVEVADNPYPVFRSKNMYSNTAMMMEGSDDSSNYDEFKKIKIRYEIQAKFEIL
jgi:uncharacterized protein YggE